MWYFTIRILCVLIHRAMQDQQQKWVVSLSTHLSASSLASSHSHSICLERRRPEDRRRAGAVPGNAEVESGREIPRHHLSRRCSLVGLGSGFGHPWDGSFLFERGKQLRVWEGRGELRRRLRSSGHFYISFWTLTGALPCQSGSGLV